MVVGDLFLVWQRNEWHTMRDCFSSSSSMLDSQKVLLCSVLSSRSWAYAPSFKRTSRFSLVVDLRAIFMNSTSGFHTGHDRLFQAQLSTCDFKHHCLVGILGNESVDSNILFLSNTVTTGLSLDIILVDSERHLQPYLRIPITIVDYNRIGSRQGDAHASCSSAQ